jgi:uncharacterized membrane protein
LTESIQLLLHLAMGISLSACAGLRAFLPLLVVGAAGRWEVVPLGESFDWLGSTPALIVFGIAVVTELVADKVPVVDNVLDGMQVFVKPIAGAFVTATVVADWAPLYVAVAAIIGGGSLAGLVHVTKAKLRLLSSVTTAGVANPAISVTEDVGVAMASVGSLFAPFVVAVLVLGALGASGWFLRRWRRSPA